jgi:hypothetical protein
MFFRQPFLATSSRDPLCDSRTKARIRKVCYAEDLQGPKPLLRNVFVMDPKFTTRTSGHRVTVSLFFQRPAINKILDQSTELALDQGTSQCLFRAKSLRGDQCAGEPNLVSLNLERGEALAPTPP